MNITCKELIDFLLVYLEGGLSDGVRRRFEAHLDLCPSCVAYLKTYRETVRLGKLAMRHPDDAVPDDVPPELVQAILTARKKERDCRSSK